MKTIKAWARTIRKGRSFKKRLATLRDEGRLIEDDETILCIERTWSTDYSVGVVGWVVGKKRTVHEIDLRLADSPVQVRQWVPRDDVAQHFSQYPVGERCGFEAQAERELRHEFSIGVRTDRGTRSLALGVQGFKPPKHKGFPEGCSFGDFVEQVNQKRMKVLEIGSREVGNRSRRDLFEGASGYVGFDYYPGPNVDVVGDAHRLSDYFAAEQFDAVFSDSVLEHLAMPWVVVMEINKVLKRGGLVYTSTPSSWPLHARPWDFWRLSDSAYQVLFSGPLGFEMVDVGFQCPMQLSLVDVDPRQTELPFNPAFGNIAVLARKTSGVSDRIKWDVGLTDVLGSKSAYPPSH